MKKLVIVLAILAIAAPAFAVSPNVRISQVYGGGGATSGTPTYTTDYVELFNNSGFDVNISGWTIEYGSATGNWGSSSSNIFTFPEGSWIAGCSYVLVALSSSTVGSPLPVTPDYTGTLTVSATNGKIALFNAVNTNLACGFELPGTLVDKVAYGTGNCPEGTAVAVLSNTTGAVRNNFGMMDTDNNLNDFTVVTAPVPHNSFSPIVECAPVPTDAQSWGALKDSYR